ncbi:Sterile alpha motif type 2 [Penicillium antarcticum]|uniref:Sterile alpha motif type 2 n=1 Tax=Penicillium antarcticum TaxID=416450 RepID=UPI002390EA13|nr:Sterile alpha motif type 2 [Penicillium antarcticum]KAJ5294284.1 Sterile alpha motif type 2 [Penicillium antarcticum]
MATYEYRPTYHHPEVKGGGQVPTPRSNGFNSFSDSIEILDTDFDSDSQSEFDDYSSHRSNRSLGTSSITTASTPDDFEIKTPTSTGLTAFDFHVEENPVAGPRGPHLFDFSDGFVKKSSVEANLLYSKTPISATTAFYSSASKLGPDRRDTPVPARYEKPQQQNHQRQTPLNNATSRPQEKDVESWDPQDVAIWMRKLNVDEGTVNEFISNDISGSILLEMEHEILRDHLGMKSFGKRHGLMNSIRQLRISNASSYKDLPPVPPPEPVLREATPQSAMAEVGVNCTPSPVAAEKDPLQKYREFQLQHQRQNQHRGRVVGPNDSVSIVAIEELLPRVDHRCPRGEDCGKWQRQYNRYLQATKGIPAELLGSSVVITGDPGNPATARNLAKSSKSDSKSDVTPSIVASSDAMGPAQPQDLPLSQEKLHEVEPRDPQENVRNFLNFQRLSRLRPVEDPTTPPRDTFPSPESVSPGTLAENLRSLPKLRIPSIHTTMAESALSGQRTITPSVVRKRQPYKNTISDTSAVTYDSAFSPADYYRDDPHYGQSTPFSEVDVPLTAIQVGPIERSFSQSVPPDMRFGSCGVPNAIISRPVSTKVESHRKKPSFSSYNPPTLSRLEEGRTLAPIETPEDLERTPRAAHHRVDPFDPSGQFKDDIIHSGWMKKRKNTRFLRHEWQDHHFALRGTQLAMYDDEESTQQAAKALEYIDVDDYAVACSSLASSSKLTAAFKKTVLKRTDDTRGDTAFAFSLIASPNSSTFDRKAIFNSTNKSHHFAVKTRDERIDWMRELMLAKALRRGRESGASLNVNGNAI